MVAGLLLALVSVVLLFWPPASAGALYFTFASSLALASFSLIDIPYIAWGSELTSDPIERSRISRWRMGAASAALLLFLAIPYIPGFGGSSFLSRDVIERLGAVAFVTVALTVLIGVRFTNRRGLPANSTAPQESLSDLWRAVSVNRPFRYVAAATFCSYVAYSIVLTLQLAFLASVGLVRDYGLVVITTTAAGVAALPAWSVVERRIGQRVGWSIGLAVSIASAPLYFILLPFTGELAAIVVSGAVFGSASIVQFMPYSVVGDVIDYDQLRSRHSHAANYSAILLVVIRLTTAVGGAIAFYVLALYHFKIGTSNALPAQRGMLLVFFGLPALFNALALVIAFFYPLSERRHAIVVKRLMRTTKSASEVTHRSE